MSLVRWKPFNDIEKLFDQDFPVLTIPKSGWDLATDVYEDKGSVVAEIHLPGIEPKDVTVTSDGHTLRVSGSREEKEERKEKNFYYKEIKRGSFERVIQLPSKVVGDKATASYKDGVLKVSVPKKEENAKKIEIKAG